MVSKEFTYRKAFENKKEAAKKRELDRSAMLSALYLTNPELNEIENRLKALGARLAITALSGDNESLEKIKAESKKLTAKKQAIIKKARIPEKTFECDVCQDSGYIGGKICECIKREAAKIMAEELSHEMPIANCSFENFDLKYYKDETDKNGTNPRRRMESILKLATDYTENFGLNSGNLLFMGGVGLGKTHITMAIVQRVVEKGFFPVYGSAENLFTAVENEKFSSENKGSYETMLNCDLLVIDDLGAEMVTSFTRSVLYNLINTRIMKNLPTIINTNLSMGEIEQKYDARISSRLIGHYNANKFLGNDIRQQKLLEN